LNHSITIWDEKWNVMKNVLRNTLGTWKNFDNLMRTPWELHSRCSHHSRHLIFFPSQWYGWANKCNG
jgi:hypothetical protein